MNGTDVYVAGYEGEVAKYWKNGVAVSLTDGTNKAQVDDITVYNGDVYIVGFEDNSSGIRVGKYWKNGLPTNFAGIDNSNEPSAIVVK